MGNIIKKRIMLKRCNVPDLRGNIYPVETVQRAIDDKKGPCFVVREVPFNYGMRIGLVNVIGQVTNLEIDNDILYGDVEAFEKTPDRILHFIWETGDNVDMSIFGLGEIEDNIVKEFKLEGVALMVYDDKEKILEEWE